MTTKEEGCHFAYRVCQDGTNRDTSCYHPREWHTGRRHDFVPARRALDEGKP